MQNSSYAWNTLRREVPEWFRDAKFGLFFHWGPYSVPAYQNEWYSRNMYAKGLEQNLYHEKTYGSLHDFGYKDFYDGLTGARFDPEAWADLVQSSGARYAGPVTEHADNFSMWNSKVNPVNCVNYGPHRDITGECAAAFRKRGIRVLSTFHHQWLWGWFMSTDPEADVYIPGNERFYGPALPLETCRYTPYRMPDAAFCRTWADKVREAVDLYRPDVLYFDSRVNIIGEEYRFEMVKHYYLDSGCSGVITYKQADFPEGTGVIDMELGHVSEAKPFPWQVDDRLEDNVTWCMVQNPKYRSAERIVQQLCDTVSKNGNLLLNVGPGADGSFHPDAVRILHEVGAWLSANGEAVYGTRPWHTAAEGPAKEADADYDVEKIHEQLRTGNAGDLRGAKMGGRDFRFTAKDGAVYAVAMGLPENGVWEIRSLGRNAGSGIVESAVLLKSGAPLSFRQEDGALLVRADACAEQQLAYGLKFVLRNP